MGEFQDQDQPTIPIIESQVPQSMQEEIVRSIMKTSRNKSLSVNDVHNEMLKPEPTLVAMALMELWKLVGRSTGYLTR